MNRLLVLSELFLPTKGGTAVWAAEVYKRLFSPYTLAGQTIRNRIAMAPLTRQMAEADGTPTGEMVAY